MAEVESLRAEVEALKRSGKRQAAPFSKGTRVKDPKRPGRKPGQGMFKRREAPAPEAALRAADRRPGRRAGLPEVRRRAGRGPRRGGLDHRPARGRPAARPALPRRPSTAAAAAARRPAAGIPTSPPTSAGPRPIGSARGCWRPPITSTTAWACRSASCRRCSGLSDRRRRSRRGRSPSTPCSKAAGAVGATYPSLCDSVRDAPYVHTDDTGWREGGLAGLADGLRDRRGDGLSGPPAAPQRGGPRADPGRLRRA